MSNSDRNDRREYRRLKVSVPVEIQIDAGGRRIRGDTADLSLGGCYIETVFPFPIGTDLAVQLSIETTVLIAATVVTCYPRWEMGSSSSGCSPRIGRRLKPSWKPLSKPRTQAPKAEF